jgi:plasmid maintenance system antidote protein VapI
MSRASVAIVEYLRQTGWKQRDLARRAEIDPAVISRAVKGRRAGIGELVAIKLERATVAAFTAGETSVPPLRALDLMSKEAA